MQLVGWLVTQLVSTLRSRHSMYHMRWGSTRHQLRSLTPCCRKTCWLRNSKSFPLRTRGMQKRQQNEIYGNAGVRTISNKTHCINNWLLQWCATDGGAQPGGIISCWVPFDWEETEMWFRLGVLFSFVRFYFHQQSVLAVFIIYYFTCVEYCLCFIIWYSYLQAFFKFLYFTFVVLKMIWFTYLEFIFFECRFLGSRVWIMLMLWCLVFQNQ
jgi:hypothetical protein